MKATLAEVALPLFDFDNENLTPTSARQLNIGQIPRDTFVRLNSIWHSRLPIVSNCCFGFCYAAEYENKYYAVAWWSHPVNAQLTNGKTLELRRMAVCDEAPRYTASRFLGAMVRDIKKRKPEIDKLISYQDSEVHKGTIYKACGWTPAAICKNHTWNGPKRGRVRNEQQSKADKVRWELMI